MHGVGAVLALGILILFLSFQAEQGGLFRDVTSTWDDTSTRSASYGNEAISSGEPGLSDFEIEQRLERLYRDLDSLEEDVREQKLREPVSPHSGTVELQVGNARSTDPDREHLILRAQYNNKAPVSISDWYLESYVTEKRAALPEGARLLETFRSSKDGNILLLPGERAYVSTAEPPLNVSFHENRCTGYLEHEGDFYPSLQRSCPRPLDELKKFSAVTLDDDDCYDFVESLFTCEWVEEEEFDNDDLSNRCSHFLENSLNYNGCVENHRGEPFFDDVGDWRIYLDRQKELWRSEREIIRLMDGNDRVVDVLEY